MKNYKFLSYTKDSVSATKFCRNWIESLKYKTIAYTPFFSYKYTRQRGVNSWDLYQGLGFCWSVKTNFLHCKFKGLTNNGFGVAKLPIISSTESYIRIKKLFVKLVTIYIRKKYREIL